MSTKVLKSALAITIILSVLMFLCACSNNEITLSVKDRNTRKKVDARIGMKISEVLDKAEIKLGEKDETDPALDSQVTSTLKEVTINRYAKVTIDYLGKKIDVEMLGGTVSDAIHKANLKLTDKNKLDKDLNTFLEDGMTIKVTADAGVYLTVDGETKEHKTGTKTVKEFLEEVNVKLGKDDIVEPKLEEKIKDGIKITVKRVVFKEEKKKETIKFAKKEKTSDSLPKGNSELTTKGVNGEKEVTYKVKYIDGKEDSREKISEKVTKKAVDQVVTKGTGPSTGGVVSNYVDDDDDYDYDYNYDNNDNTPASKAEPQTAAPKIDEGAVGDVD